MSEKQRTPRARKARLTPHEEFYAAIGEFVVAWAGMEFCLDLVLLSAIRGAAQEKLKLPHQFADKIVFLQSETMVLGSEQRAAITQLLAEISTYAESRHDFVHGSIIDHNIEQGVITARLWRLLQPPRRPRRKAVKVTAPEITKIAGRIREFGDRLLIIADALCRTE